jgi:hypothetical protein
VNLNQRVPKAFRPARKKAPEPASQATTWTCLLTAGSFCPAFRLLRLVLVQIEDAYLRWACSIFSSRISVTSLLAAARLRRRTGLPMEYCRMSSTVFSCRKNRPRIRYKVPRSTLDLQHSRTTIMWDLILKAILIYTVSVLSWRFVQSYFSPHPLDNIPGPKRESFLVGTHAILNESCFPYLIFVQEILSNSLQSTPGTGMIITTPRMDG